MITSELGWAMCGADVDMPSQQQMNLLCWAGMFLLGYGSGHNGSFGIYGELQSLLQTSAPPPSAVSKVQQSVYTWGWLHRPRKNVCVQVHVYSHMHICTGMWREAPLVWPTWLESTRSHMKGKVQRVNSRPCCRLRGIKDCSQVPSEQFKGAHCEPTSMTDGHYNLLMMQKWTQRFRAGRPVEPVPSHYCMNKM